MINEGSEEGPLLVGSSFPTSTLVAQLPRRMGMYNISSAEERVEEELFVKFLYTNVVHLSPSCSLLIEVLAFLDLMESLLRLRAMRHL